MNCWIFDLKFRVLNTSQESFTMNSPTKFPFNLRDLPVRAIKAYDSNKKQLNLIPDDQFFNGLFRLCLLLYPQWDLYSSFFHFVFPIFSQKSKRFPKSRKSLHFVVIFFLVSSSFSWDFEQFHSLISHKSQTRRETNRDLRIVVIF